MLNLETMDTSVLVAVISAIVSISAAIIISAQLEIQELLKRLGKIEKELEQNL